MIGSGVPAIRPVEDGDIAAIAAIEQEVFSDPWSERSLRDSAQLPDVLFLVAVGAQVDGYLIAYCAEDVAELANLAVRSAAQGRGVARALLAGMASDLRRRGVAEVWLEVRASNARARNVYSRFGFIESGLRKRYYSRPVEDAVIMRWVLTR